MITFWTFHYFTPFLYFLLSFYYEIYICLYHFIMFLQVFHNEGLEDFKIHHTIYFKIYSNSVYRNNFLKKRSEEHTSELQSRGHLVCRLLLEKKKKKEKRRIR